MSHRHSLNLIKKPKKKYYDAVLITVEHKKILLLKKKYIYSLLKNRKQGVIFDVKNIFEEKNFLTI